MRIAVVGGTGSFGKALAARLVDAGEEVVVGSREAERGAAAAAEVGAAGGGTNEEVVRGADLVVLAVKADAMVETGRELAGAIAAPVLCVGSELSFSKSGVRPSPEARSLAERLQDVLGAPVVAGLHSLAAATLAGEEPPEEDALVCGDDAEAKERALEVAAKLVAGRALDAGPLAGARALEGMTGVIVNLNRRYRGHAGLRVTGLP